MSCGIVVDVAWIPRCCGCGLGWLAGVTLIHPYSENFHMLQVWP